jgi:tetratricopeptide (TPR) repeat protein
MRRWAAILAVACFGLHAAAFADGYSDAKACIDARVRGDYETAITHCSRALRSVDLSNEDFLVVLQNRAAAFTGKGDDDRAIQDWDQAIRLSPDNADFYNNRGRAYDSKGDHDRAIQDYDQAIRFEPENAVYYYNRGIAYGREDMYDRAIQDLDQAIRLNPDFAEAYSSRGNAYNAKGAYDLAIQDLDQAIRLNPDLALAYYNRGNAYFAKAAYDRAIEDYDRAIRLEPDFAVAYFSRGRAYNGKGEYDRAIQDFDQAIRLNPDDFAVEFSWDRALAHVGLARFPEATGDLARYVSAKPKDAYAVLWLYLARQRDRKGGAEELDVQAKALDLAQWPGPIIRYYQGLISAEALLKAAADPDPKTANGRDCEAVFYIGETDLIAGRAVEAKTRFQHALDICPSEFVVTGAARAELGRL